MDEKFFAVEQDVHSMLCKLIDQENEVSMLTERIADLLKNYEHQVDHKIKLDARIEELENANKVISDQHNLAIANFTELTLAANRRDERIAELEDENKTYEGLIENINGEIVDRDERIEVIKRERDIRIAELESKNRQLEEAMALMRGSGHGDIEIEVLKIETGYQIEIAQRDHKIAIRDELLRKCWPEISGKKYDSAVHMEILANPLWHEIITSWTAPKPREYRECQYPGDCGDKALKGSEFCKAHSR